MTPGQVHVVVAYIRCESVEVTYVLRHPLLLAGLGGIGVYVAQIASGSDVYVGSVFRPQNANGIAHRIQEHRATDRCAAGARRWTGVHVFALSDPIREMEVRTLEGFVGRILAPSGNRRLPRGGTR